MSYEEKLIRNQIKKTKKKAFGSGRRTSDHPRKQRRRCANQQKH